MNTTCKCSPCAVCDRAAALCGAITRRISRVMSPEARAGLWPFEPDALALARLVPGGSRVLLIQEATEAPAVLVRRGCRLHVAGGAVPDARDAVWKETDLVLLRPGEEWTQDRLDETVALCCESLKKLPYARLLIACPNVGAAPASAYVETSAEAPEADIPWTVTGLETCFEVRALRVEHRYCLPGRRTPARCPASRLANRLRSLCARLLCGRFAGQFLYQVRPLLHRPD